MNAAKVHSRQDFQVGMNEKGPTVIREDPEKGECPPDQNVGEGTLVFAAGAAETVVRIREEDVEAGQAPIAAGQVALKADLLVFG